MEKLEWCVIVRKKLQSAIKTESTAEKSPFFLKSVQRDSTAWETAADTVHIAHNNSMQ